MGRPLAVDQGNVAGHALGGELRILIVGRMLHVLGDVAPPVELPRLQERIVIDDVARPVAPGIGVERRPGLLPAADDVAANRQPSDLDSVTPDSSPAAPGRKRTSCADVIDDGVRRGLASGPQIRVLHVHGCRLAAQH